MQLNFTINCTLEIPRAEYSAKVNSVVDGVGQDITNDFLSFCSKRGLPLTSEDEIRTAAYAYGLPPGKQGSVPASA